MIFAAAATRKLMREYVTTGIEKLAEILGIALMESDCLLLAQQTDPATEQKRLAMAFAKKAHPRPNASAHGHPFKQYIAKPQSQLIMLDWLKNNLQGKCVADMGYININGQVRVIS